MEIDPSWLWNSFFVHLKTSLKKEVEDRQEERRSTTQAIEIVCFRGKKGWEHWLQHGLHPGFLTHQPPQQGSSSPKHSYMGFELSLQSSLWLNVWGWSDERLSKKPTKSIYLTKKDPNVSSPRVLTLGGLSGWMVPPPYCYKSCVCKHKERSLTLAKSWWLEASSPNAPLLFVAEYFYTSLNTCIPAIVTKCTSTLLEPSLCM